METLYAFRDALLQVHRPGRLKPARLKSFAGTRVTERWCILRPKRAGAVLRHLAHVQQDVDAATDAARDALIADLDQAVAPYRPVGDV